MQNALTEKLVMQELELWREKELILLTKNSSLCQALQSKITMI